jgi:hypothetical protein
MSCVAESREHHRGKAFARERWLHPSHHLFDPKRVLQLIDRLARLVDEIGGLQSKLVLLLGPPGAGKTALLHAMAAARGMSVLNAGAELGARLAALPQKQRRLHASSTLRDLANNHAKDDVLLLDNIELLFDSSLHLNPLDTLKRHAHARRVVAAWPGEFSKGRLIYAALGHPEHQDYGSAGWVAFEIE